MNNIEGLRDELAKVFVALKNKKMEPKIAKELNNSAGKIMASLKIEMEYAAARKERPVIPYIMTNDAVQNR